MLGALLAGAVTLILAPVVLGGLRSRQVLDVPTPRSSHDRPTPRGGGLAPAVGALLALGVTDSVTGDPRVALAVAGAGFALAGVVEDLRGVPPVRRFLSQLAMAVACLPWLLADLRRWPVVAGAITVLWLVAYVNGFNFMDGINGISVAQALVAGLAWWTIGEWRDLPPLAGGGMIIAAAAAGFLPFNFPRARMFLGDVGSYFFGGWLGVLAVVGLRGGLTVEAAFAPLALYLADTGTTLVRRAIRREIWYAPHRDHAYQRLVIRGFSHTQVTALVAAIIAACSALGAATLVAPLGLRVLSDAALALLLAGYLASPRTASGSIWPRSRRHTA